MFIDFRERSYIKYFETNKFGELREKDILPVAKFLNSNLGGGIEVLYGKLQMIEMRLWGLVENLHTNYLETDSTPVCNMVLYIQSSPTILIKDTILAPILFNFCVASMSINAPSRNCMQYLDDSTLYHICTLQKKRHMHQKCWKWNQLNWNLVLDRWHCVKSEYEYREILRTSPYSVQMLENTDHFLGSMIFSKLDYCIDLFTGLP